MVQLQAQINSVKTELAASQTADGAQARASAGLVPDEADMVRIAERVTAAAISAVKSECAKVAKVEAGVAAKSMIPSIKAECMATMNAVVQKSDVVQSIQKDYVEVQRQKGELESLRTGFEVLRGNYESLVARVDQLCAPKKAAVRKLPAAVKKVVSDPIVI
jgi:hypothetical protein